jgi:hypothetical protein
MHFLDQTHGIRLTHLRQLLTPRTDNLNKVRAHKALDKTIGNTIETFEKRGHTWTDYMIKFWFI